MADAKTPETKPDQKTEAVKMTAAEAAKQVKRTVTTVIKPAKDGQPAEVKTEKVAVKADEVLAFKDYGTHVMVVTKDGQKFSSVDA